MSAYRISREAIDHITRCLLQLRGLTASEIDLLTADAARAIEQDLAEALLDAFDDGFREGGYAAEDGNDN